jgi:hypothetical protein
LLQIAARIVCVAGFLAERAIVISVVPRGAWARDDAGGLLASGLRKTGLLLAGGLLKASGAWCKGPMLAHGSSKGMSCLVTRELSFEGEEFWEDVIESLVVVSPSEVASNVIISGR